MKSHSMQANRRERREIGCAGKVRFASYELASKIASRQAHRRGRKFNVYACEACGGFHVGNAIGGSKQRPGAIDPRKPYLVYTRDIRGNIKVMGRSAKPDGGKLAEIVAADGWEVTNIMRVK